MSGERSYLCLEEAAVVAVLHVVPEVDEGEELLEVEGTALVEVDTAEERFESRAVCESIFCQLVFELHVHEGSRTICSHKYCYAYCRGFYGELK